MTVSTATIYEDVYDAIRTLLVANKPTYTYDGTVYTYNIIAEYGRADASFPCIVLNKSMIKMSLLTLDSGTHDYIIEVQMDLYAKEKHGKKVLDTALSSLLDLFVTNFSTLDTDNSLVPMEDFWDDSNNSEFEDRNQVLNTVSVIMRFKR